jgi:chitodextrinase
MKLNVELYIDTSGSPLNTPIYERVDFFDFESIELTSSQQDIRDISKVFTDYSQEFSVPASKTNNRIFKHYYNPNITNGFDARVKQRGQIYLNGILFKDVYIRLSDSEIVNGRVSSYRLTLFGSMVELKDVVGDDELSVLEWLNNYSHDYSASVVYNGFVTGLGLSGGAMVTSINRDVVYPAISASDRWYYDTIENGGVGKAPSTYKQGQQVNLYDPADDGTYGINYTQLKPAIKAKHIISAIEEKYPSISFSNDFFENIEFDQLYLLLHNNKGTMSGRIGSSKTYRIGTGDADSEFTYVYDVSSSPTDLRPMVTNTIGTEEDIPYYYNAGATYYIITLDISDLNPTSDVLYTVELLEGGVAINTWKDNSADGTFAYELRSQDEKTWDNLSYRITTDTVSTFDVDFTIERQEEIQGDVSEGYNPPNDVSYSEFSQLNDDAVLSEVVITERLPKIKVLDFLKGIFSMFNLTSYYNSEGVIVVETLDEFYDSGVEIDITNQIDKKSHSVKRMSLFSNISFEYQEPKTFGTINQNEQQVDNFGELEYQLRSNSLLFDGNKYTIKLPFEKMFFDRLSEEQDVGVLIPFGSGWLVDKDQNEVVTNPVLFFNRNTSVNKATYQIGFLGVGNIETYNRPSNSSNNELSTLNFNSEFDEYSGNTINRSLFALYYSNYIANVYARATRLYNYKAILNLGTMLDYNMNDKFVVDGTRFVINNIRTNLTNGETDLELITQFPISEAEAIVDVTAPSVPSGLAVESKTDTTITFSWTASTDAGTGVYGYEVYVDAVLVATIGVTTMYEVTGLTASTSYDLTVKAFDGNSNTSAASTALTTSTNASSDTIKPTTPTSLGTDSVSKSTIIISWTASTDNVAVTGYEIEIDDGGGYVLDGTTASTSYSILSLTTGTSYWIRVRAYDAAGNKSNYAFHFETTI